MIAPLSRVPALPVVLGIAGGIWLWIVGVGWLLPVVMVCGGVGLMFWRRHYLAFGLYAAALGWGTAAFNVPNPAPEGIFDGVNRTYMGVVKKISGSPTGQTIVVEIDSIETAGQMVQCSPFKISAGMNPDWSMYVGERLCFKAILEPLDSHGDFPHDRDNRFTNLRKGIVGQAYVAEYNITRVGDERSLVWWFGQRRDSIVRLLAHSELSEDAYALLSALTVGYGDELPDTMRQSFRAAGIAHALALSGFHVGIIVMVVSAVLFPLRAYYRLRRLRMVLALALVWFYAAMVGMPDSVLRAVVMLSILFGAKIAGLESSPFNSLFAAGAVILAASPFSLFAAGFQLSFFAVAGILALSSPLNPFNPQRRFAYNAAMVLAVPLAAIVGTMAVTAASFHRLPLMFCVANLVISLLLPPLMCAGIGVIVAVACGFKAVWLCAVCDWLTEAIEWVAQEIASLPFAELSGIYLNGWQVTAIVVAALALMLAANFRNRRMLVGSGSIIVCALLVIAFCGTSAPETEAFIIRQAANTPVVMRHGRTAVAVFTCRERNLANARARFEKRIAPWLEARGIDTLTIARKDFALGPYARRGNVLEINGWKYALASQPGYLDSIAEKVDYALVCSQFRGSIANVEEMLHPDTILLSRDLSLRRAARLKSEAILPVIDLRNSRHQLPDGTAAPSQSRGGSQGD